MKGSPPDNRNPQPQELAQDCVQDYLDMLLMQTEESSAAPMISHSPEQSQPPQDDVQTPAKSKVLPSLTMVGGRSLLPASTQPSVADQLPIRPGKPFAEPTKSLAFKMPLPTERVSVEPAVVETVVETVVKTVVKTVVETVDQPSVKTVDKAPPKPPPPVAPSIDEAAIDGPVIEGSAIYRASTEPEPPKQEIEAASKPKEVVATTVWLDNGRPSWAQQRFECLLFSVGGLTLAVPLVELGTIYPVGDELTPIFGQIDWFLGLLPVKETSIRTVNTAKVVMPERYSDRMKDQLRYVISISGMDWGLAVDSVSNAITLNPEEVRWRSKRSKRPWLAGTVVEHMCALLDLSQLAAMFIEQDS